MAFETMKNYDLSIAYRIYPWVSKVPPVFKDDKYKLSEFCLKSLKNSLGDLKAKIFVLLDDCPPEYEELFKKYFDEADLELIRLDGVGNLATFALQIKILLEQNISDLVYFAEDDYFYMPEQFKEMVELLKDNDDVDFVSPYDHPDDYILKLHEHPYQIKATAKRHWRTASSTCLTFLTDKTTLKKTKEVFESYSHGNHDASVWMSLTKYNMFNPVKTLKNREEHLYYKVIQMAWRYNWKQLLMGNKWQLWIPTPTIGIHLESDFLPPTRKCLEFMEDEASKMDLNY
ncbi:MAG: glycosyltransferase [Methanobacterium sp.]